MIMIPAIASTAPPSNVPTGSHTRYGMLSVTPPITIPQPTIGSVPYSSISLPGKMLFSANVTADANPQISASGEIASVPRLPCVARITVPPTASARTTSLRIPGRVLVLTATHSMISTGERYSSTVAVPALDSPIVTKYVSWHIAMPSTPNASKCSAVFGFFHTFRMLLTLFACAALMHSKSVPATSMRTVTSHPASTPRRCIRNCPHAPENPQHTPPASVSRIPMVRYRADFFCSITIRLFNNQ